MFFVIVFLNVEYSLHGLQSDGKQNMHTSKHVTKYVGNYNFVTLYTCSLCLPPRHSGKIQPGPVRNFLNFIFKNNMAVHSFFVCKNILYFFLSCMKHTFLLSQAKGTSLAHGKSRTTRTLLISWYPGM